MEIRLRRFLNIKRAKKDTQPVTKDIKVHSHLSDSPQWPSTALDSLALPSIDSEGQSSITSSDPLVQTIPYGTVFARKTPIFTSEPVKGNGPIKLQTSWRMSSGEVMSATQDSRRTLEDIREGDYVVACREKRGLRSQSFKSTISQPTPPLSISYSDTLSSPRTTPATPTSPWSRSSTDFVDTPNSHSSRKSANSLGIVSSSTNSLQFQSSHGNTEFSDIDSKLRTSNTSYANSPFVQNVEEQNATVAALWRAEYNRLVGLYGRSHVDGKTSDASAMSLRNHVALLRDTRCDIRSLEAALDSLPIPDSSHFSDQIKRSSDISTVSRGCQDDNSDTSSRTRSSMVSSCARSSSYTTQTSITEHDTITTKADIHRVVNEMRSTYLRALENHSPTPSKHSQSGKKRRRAKHPMPVTRNAVAQSDTVDRQTWHGNGPNVTHKSRQRSSQMRATSHPPAGLGRLSPVEASPPGREKRPTVQLQRADSGTLGSLMAQLRIEGEKVEPTKITLIRQDQLPLSTAHLDEPSLSVAARPVGNFF